MTSSSNLRIQPSTVFKSVGLDEKTTRLLILSMGMSADYAQAIAFGATHIRLGTAIFGPRTPLRPD